MKTFLQFSLFLTVFSVLSFSHAQPVNRIQIKLDQLDDGGTICKMHFSYENKSNLNFTKLYGAFLVHDRKGYLVESNPTNSFRLPPGGRARTVAFASAGCSELQRIQADTMNGTPAYLTQIDNTSISQAVARTIKFESSGGLSGVSLLGSR